MRKIKTFGPQSEEVFGFLGVEAAGTGLGRLGALRRAEFFPDSAKPGGSGGFAPSTNSTRSQVSFAELQSFTSFTLSVLELSNYRVKRILSLIFFRTR